jgi:hypothetical protein
LEDNIVENSLLNQPQARAERRVSWVYWWLIVSVFVSVPWLLFNQIRGSRTRPASYDQIPVWSPDGRNLIILRNGSPIILDPNSADLPQQPVQSHIDTIITSPDGQSGVVMDCYLGADSCGLFTVSRDGTHWTQVLSQTQAIDLTWLPGARQIAFMNQEGIYVIDNDGGSPELIRSFNAADEPGQIAWSPDGQKIAFTIASEIFTMDIDGAGMAWLVDMGVFIADLVWSPDGRQIALVAPELYVLNRDGSGLKDLAPELQNNQGNYRVNPGIQWSPAGQQIAFGTYNGLYLANTDGTGAKQLTSSQGNNASQASWSPDGTRIAYESSFNCGEDLLGTCQDRYEINVINADGTGLVNLSRQELQLVGNLWSVVMPDLIHLILLPGLFSPYRYARRHTQQALLLAGMRAIVSAVLIGLIGVQYLTVCGWIIVYSGLWLFGSGWGLRQVRHGNCWLMRLAGESGELPRPWAAAQYASR